MTTTAISNTNETPRAFDLIRHPAQGTTELFLVRHGQTEGNARHLFIGSTDMPLDPVGARQAKRIGDRFASLHIDALISSPMLRARQTAAEISRTTHKEIEIVPGLSEIDFGDLEGYTIEQVVQQFPEIRDKLDLIEETDIAWPGGESRSGFNARVLAGFLGILERYVDQTVAVVCHGGVIGSFIAQIEGGSPNDFATYAFQNCSLTHLVVTPEQTLIHFRNDFSHLEEVQREALRLSPRLMKENAQ
ncbi:MAG TPA: histidine phosphatase family protein [Thermomicrobiales bacterium]|nr:histidine phosphatase family protein [Thermomicrobiales bacterium]